MELILFSLGYRRVNGGQGWYCYENNETGIIIDYHVARTAHRFERRIEVDFTVRDLNRKRLCLANFPGESPLTYETQAELDGKLRHTFDATVNMALPYIQDMKKYAVPVPCLKDYQALADHPERRAELFSFKYHMIPDKSSLIQLDSILQSIRPKNLYELRDSFQANYEDLINMAAFYGILFAKNPITTVWDGLRSYPKMLQCLLLRHGITWTLKDIVFPLLHFYKEAPLMFLMPIHLITFLEAG